MSTFEKLKQKLKCKILSQIDKWMEDADLNHDGSVFLNRIFRPVLIIYIIGVVSYEEFKKSLQKAISSYFDI